MKIVYYFGWLVYRIVGWVCGMKRTGIKNIPKNGPFILASNHQSYADPPILGSWLNRQVHFFAKKELWKNKLLGWAISQANAFPVNRGAVDRNAAREIRKVFDQDHGLVFFPEGTRGKGEKFLPAKPGLGLMIKLSGMPVPIIPVYLHCTHRLKDCLMRRKHLTMIIGSPIPAEEVAEYLTNKEGYQALADKVMVEIQKLKESL